MLKKKITYKDFDGNEVTEEHYFNISKAKLIEMESATDEGLGDSIQAIVKAGNVRSLIREFRKILLASYGVKSEDGKRFIQSEQLSEEFGQTAAYDQLFIDLVTNEKMAAEFISGILPSDLAEQVAKMTDQDKPTGPPPRAIAPLPPRRP
jgi:hypothetical protein